MVKLNFCLGSTPVGMGHQISDLKDDRLNGTPVGHVRSAMRVQLKFIIWHSKFSVVDVKCLFSNHANILSYTDPIWRCHC